MPPRGICALYIAPPARYIGSSGGLGCENRTNAVFDTKIDPWPGLSTHVALYRPPDVRAEKVISTGVYVVWSGLRSGRC